MKGRLLLDIRESQLRKDGYPVIFRLSNKGTQKSYSLGLRFMKKNWDFKKEEPKTIKRDILYIKKKKLLLEELCYRSLDDKTITFEFIKAQMKGEDEVKKVKCFYKYSENYIQEIEQKLDGKGFKKVGNANSYKAAIAQMKKYKATLLLSEIDYRLLSEFKTWQFSKGNKKNTVAAYMKSFRALYKEAVRRKLVEDTNPFEGVFKGITVKKNRTKKKHVSKETILKLENIKDLPRGRQEALDIWLLLFYFGGLDFKDLYYLENKQISKGRVYITRGKLNEGGYEFDLKIFDKAKKILDKYRVKDDRFVFPWRKDYDGYKTFYSRLRRNLQRIQKDNDISVEPLGGTLGTKVTRHTFATIGSRLFVEPDLLRSLMGHERDDIDTVYKDIYPEKLRDEYHLKIISTT